MACFGKKFGKNTQSMIILTNVCVKLIAIFALSIIIRVSFDKKRTTIWNILTDIKGAKMRFWCI